LADECRERGILLRILGNRALSKRIVSAISRLSTLALLLGVAGCVSRHRAETGLPAQMESSLPGTYAVLICRGSASCASRDTSTIYSDGTVVILDREVSILADTLRRLYPNSEIPDSAFAHVQACYLFRRHAPIEGREGPHSSGFSDLFVLPAVDSVSFSLGESADAGYTATVRVNDGAMSGTATGWNSQELFRVDTLNGQRILRRRTKTELAAVGRKADRLIGRRVGPPNQRVCLRGENY
jgi:hypothetical protein